MKIKKVLKSKLVKIIKRYNLSEIKPIHIPIVYGDFLTGKTVLITGGTSGIGLAIAKACLHNKANVIITGRNQEKIDKTCKMLENEINKNVPNFIFGITMDIENVNSIQNTFDLLLSNPIINEIDVLINNAGISSGANFGETDIESYDKVLNTNMRGTYFLSQIFSNYLIKNKIQGNILNVLSSSSIRPANLPYCITKWGELGLTKGMAKKLISHGIVVNGIAPGPTATAMLGKDGQDIYNYKSPSGRYATAEEIANFSVMLISDMGRMIVGDVLYITGGCGNLTLDDIKY